MAPALPFKELLYLLNGFEGGLFSLDRDVANKLMDDEALSRLIDLCDLQIIRELNLIACDYSIIYKFLQETQVITCDYLQFLREGLEKFIEEYQSVLQQLELEIKFITLCSFNKLIKFKESMRDVAEFVIKSKKMSYIDIFSFLHRKLSMVYPSIRNSYSIILRHYKIAFFNDIWSWCVLGYLNETKNHFFIIRNPDNENKVKGPDQLAKIHPDRIPSFLSEEMINRIELSGKLIYFFDKNYDISPNEIFAENFTKVEEQFEELCDKKDFDNHELGKFIISVSSHVFKFAFFHLMNKEKILEHLEIIKSTHLMGNQTFWLNLIEDLSNIRSYKGVYNLEYWVKNFNFLWKKNLCDFYGEDHSENYISIVQIKNLELFNGTDGIKVTDISKMAGHELMIPKFSFTYNFPAMINMVINESSYVKYDMILNFFFQLCQAKCYLSKCWKYSLRCTSIHLRKLQLIRFRLMAILENIFYFYKVNVIEKLYCNFLDDLLKYQDIFTMELCHHNFVFNLIKESLLNIDSIQEILCKLFSQCHRLYLLHVNTINDQQLDSLDRDLNELYMKLYYLLANVKSYELSPSLGQLLFQIGKMLVLDGNKPNV